MRPDSTRTATRLAQALLALLLVASSTSTLFVAAKKSTPPAAPGPATNGKGEAISLRGNTEKTVPIRTHSLYAPYVDSDLQNRWFDFGGSTIINTNKHVRLTQDRPSEAGWLWSRLALAPNSFEVEFEFRVDGRSNNLFGDGMALWLTKGRATMGPAFGNADYWDGLGIFFDTYANSRHSYQFPRIYAILNDGTKSFAVGKDGADQEIGACSLNFRRTDVTAKARLTYFRGKFLELAVQHKKWDEWTTCFAIEGIELPSQPFLGFSALTGDVSVVYHAPAAGAKPPSRRSIPGAGFFSKLFSLLKWVFLIVIVVVAVMAYRGRKATRSAKRF
ncbi:hypothetical protein JCM8202v2_000646 [Rhodotorula sphaerocarpa]